MLCNSERDPHQSTLECANKDDLEVAEWLVVFARGGKRTMTSAPSSSSSSSSTTDSAWNRREVSDLLKEERTDGGATSKKRIKLEDREFSSYAEHDEEQVMFENNEEVEDQQSQPIIQQSTPLNSKQVHLRCEVQEYEVSSFSDGNDESTTNTSIVHDNNDEVLSAEDIKHLRANPQASYIPYLNVIIARIRDENPESVTLRQFFQKLIQTKVFCPLLQKKMFLVTQEFDRMDSIQRKQIIQTNKLTSKRDDEFYNFHFKAILQTVESKGLKSLIEVIYWSIVILSVKQYGEEDFKVFDVAFFEKDYEKHITHLGIFEKDFSVLVRYCNNMRAANKVLPTYYKQKFRHNCGEILEMSGMRRTLGGAPSKVTAMMTIISKREGVLNR